MSFPFPYKSFSHQLDDTIPLYHSIIELSNQNPMREKKPSIDLGAHYDVAHGLLFGAKTHYMVDRVYDESSVNEVLKRLEELGAKTRDVVSTADTSTTIDFLLGSDSRKLVLVANDVQSMVQNEHVQQGLSAVLLKGRGGIRSEGSDVEALLPIFQDLIGPQGLYLGFSTPFPFLGFTKEAEGTLPFATLTGLENDDRYMNHQLFRRK